MTQTDLEMTEKSELEGWETENRGIELVISVVITVDRVST